MSTATHQTVVKISQRSGGNGQLNVAYNLKTYVNILSLKLSKFENASAFSTDQSAKMQILLFY